MRIFLTALSLLIVAMILGILAKNQLTTVSTVPAHALPASSAMPAGSSNTAATPKQQLQHFQQALDKAMQQSQPPTTKDE